MPTSAKRSTALTPKYDPLPLALSKRAAAKKLGIDRGRTLSLLIRTGRLRTVPWGNAVRIPLAEVERLAAEGFDAKGAAPRAAQAPRARRGTVDPAALRRMTVGDILARRKAP
ncbi:hypothetical protein Adeh_1836 [Anaeromyxobacter dehalogenans 2CP-C]|uniref:Helix-turn-helix domain-containing protein n=1 Tax=Anaeromyxobacter dehalogenans (strain 2CP-C) TaxID=290397 RepID=Q2IIX7_ANADE|nr:hypothetical protein Adeh_1836 [Anaeromyxobacter dehalogenans 2CP-C]